MSNVNILLSNSDVAMLQVPVLLATAEFELVYTLVYMYTVKPRFLTRTACNGYHLPVSIRDMNVKYRSISKDITATSTQP